MDLSHTAATTRPRAPMESIDLGFALARTWFLPLWACWWAAAAPIALVTLVLLNQQPGLWLLALWWCKPAFEALPLYWLSRAFFGERLPLRVAVRRLPRALPRRLWPQLLWRRIGLGRSFSMPVTLLEAPRGAARGERLRVLGTGAAGWLTVICVHLESVLWLGGLLALAFLLPEGLPGFDLDAALLAEHSAPYWIANLLMLLAMSVMAPFYVAAGFALYLGRRTRLEAWDLELEFRRARAARRGPRRRSALVTILALGLCLPAAPRGPAQAQTQSEARELIDAVLSEPDFGSTREEPVWVYVGDDDEAPGPRESSTWLPAWLIGGIATVMKWAALLAGAVLVALLALKILEEYRHPWKKRRPPATTLDAPANRDTLLVPSFPAQDLAAGARRLLDVGDARGALALLYQGLIVRLRDDGARLPDSATESDCLEAAASLTSAAELDWIRRLIRLWRAVAYAHRNADAAALSALLDDLPQPLAAGSAGTAHHG